MLHIVKRVMITTAKSILINTFLGVEVYSIFMARNCDLCQEQEAEQTVKPQLALPVFDAETRKEITVLRNDFNQIEEVCDRCYTALEKDEMIILQ